jgi:hypothetical protein
MMPNHSHMTDELGASLLEEKAQKVAGPCPGCRHLSRCTTEQLACRALEIFHEFGRPSIAPRHPSAEIFVRMHARKPRLRPAEERQRAKEALAVALRREAVEF